MEITLNETERVALGTAVAREKRVRHWRRLRAIQLLAEHVPPATVARVLGCSLASVYNWASAWQADRLNGLRERPRPGQSRRLDSAAEHRLSTLLDTDPQSRGYHATGWTVPLLRTELAQAGYPVGERTIRRTLHRLGWRWKRPTYVLGRPDPEYGTKRGGDGTGSVRAGCGWRGLARR